jgi:hypothetical protein
MELPELVQALLSYDALAARQWVADSLRTNLSWKDVPRPRDLDEVGLGVAAGVAELLSLRAGQQPPAWVAAVAAVPQPIYLVRSVASMPRLKQLCDEESPEPLRRRRIYAPPEFLKVV